MISIGEQLTVWQDTGPPGNHPPVPSGQHITLTRAHLIELLQVVHRDLTAFNAALAAWAIRHTDERPDLTARINTAFVFTAPLAIGAIDAELDQPCRTPTHPTSAKITFTDLPPIGLRSAGDRHSK